MAENELPQFDTLEELTEFFDANDMGDYWQTMPEVEFEITLAKKTRLVAIEEALAERRCQNSAGVEKVTPEAALSKRGSTKNSS